MDPAPETKTVEPDPDELKIELVTAMLDALLLKVEVKMHFSNERPESAELIVIGPETKQEFMVRLLSLNTIDPVCKLVKTVPEEPTLSVIVPNVDDG